MVLERLLTPIATRPAKATVKAAYGPGIGYFATDTPLSSLRRTPQKMAADAQNVYLSNKWIRAAERAISQQFGAVPWHLEDDEDEAVTDESNPQLVAIRDLLEKPYRPQEGDPINATPRTRSGLWGLTCRHMGVTGSAFWYLDKSTYITGLPGQILYINPSRMTPAGSEGRLTGWVLDADNRGGGIPLEAKDVLHFTLEEPDNGFFPAGLVESAMADVYITRSGDRHAAGVLSSGGKMQGVYSPKSEAGVMPPDVFAQLERELRASAEDPDATRRSIILRGPIDFTPTAATPEQLDLVAIANMARDDVFTLWNTPLSQVGAAAPVGLNSAGNKDSDEAVFWQKAIHPRLNRFWETLQYEFLDRYAAAGTAVEMVLEEPTFDDDAPKYELATKAVNIPLTNNERRAILGLDPFQDEALGNMIVMPMQIVEYGTSVSSRPADDIPLEGVQAKAKTAVVNRLVSRLEKDLRAYLTEQRQAISAKVQTRSAHLSKNPSDDSVWWKGEEWDKRLAKLLAPYANELADLSASQSAKVLKLKPAKAEFTDLTGNAVLQRLLTRLGGRISGINETTRLGVARAIKEGVEAGDGAAQLGDRVEAISGFDEYRAELIARTESARVLNEAQLESFREYGVNRVRAIDGDDDEECAARDGQEYDLDDALDIADHPNGTLDWVPVI